MLHATLDRFSNINFISRINRAFWPVARELQAMGFPFPAVNVYSNPDASVLSNLFTFRSSYDPNQWLVAHGRAFDFGYCLRLPFRNGVTLPYSLEIILDSRAPVRATLNAWFTNRGRWYTEPLDPVGGKRLRALRLPGVGWAHASGGLKHRLNCGGLILPPDASCPTNRWVVYSAYQGFLIEVRPRVTKYLKAAAGLQELLRSW